MSQEQEKERIINEIRGIVGELQSLGVEEVWRASDLRPLELDDLREELEARQRQLMQRKKHLDGLKKK